MIVIKKYSKYLLILIPAAFCVIALFLNQKQKAPAQQIRAVTEFDRSAWLLTQGWQGELQSSRAVVIPDADSGNPDQNYQNYIQLQAQQNLPFTDYAGTNGILYTYALKDSGLCAELLTADGILVGAQCYYPGADSETLDMQGNPILNNQSLESLE